MSVEQYEKVAGHAARLQKKSLEQVSAGDLIRDAIELYVEALDEDNDSNISTD